MIPDWVLNILMTQFAEATVWAVQGDWGEGYRLLLSGRDTALLLLQDGFAWGEELARRYEGALDNYIRQHGPPWEPW